MAQNKEITLIEVWKANEESLGHEIKMGTNLFKQVRIMYLLQIGDVEMASIVAVQNDNLWRFFKECLVNPQFEVEQKWIEKFCA